MLQDLRREAEALAELNDGSAEFRALAEELRSKVHKAATDNPEGAIGQNLRDLRSWLEGMCGWY